MNIRFPDIDAKKIFSMAFRRLKLDVVFKIAVVAALAVGLMLLAVDALVFYSYALPVIRPQGGQGGLEAKSLLSSDLKSARELISRSSEIFRSGSASSFSLPNPFR